MKMTLRAGAAIVAGVLAPLLASAQEPAVTLILRSGEEINCRVVDIWKGEIYFEAASAEVAYRYGDRVSLDNVAQVKLKDGRTLNPAEFVDYREGRYQPAASQPAPAPQSPSPIPAKAEAQAGMRLARKTLQNTSEKSETRIGLRLPEVPALAGRQISFEASQVADLIAELGLGGRLLYETSRGPFSTRKLTDSQRSVLEALKQSAVWQRRKADLRDASQQAFDAFNAQHEQQPDILRSQFNFEARQGATAFLEFVQYLHLTAVANVEAEWQKVEQLFGRRGASALLDLLNNYDDWYYLYGAELEKR